MSARDTNSSEDIIEDVVGDVWRIFQWKLIECSNLGMPCPEGKAFFEAITAYNSAWKALYENEHTGLVKAEAERDQWKKIAEKPQSCPRCDKEIWI